MSEKLLNWMEEHAGHYRGNLRDAIVAFVYTAKHGPRTQSRAHYGFVDTKSPTFPEKRYNMTLAEYLLDESLFPFLHKVEDVSVWFWLQSTYRLLKCLL
jgi:hypothetical protein